MQLDELRLLVKHLDPEFVNANPEEISVTDPKIAVDKTELLLTRDRLSSCVLQALIDQSKEKTIQYLTTTYDMAWVHANLSALALPCLLCSTSRSSHMPNCAALTRKAAASILHSSLGPAVVSRSRSCYPC